MCQLEHHVRLDIVGFGNISYNNYYSNNIKSTSSEGSLRKSQPEQNNQTKQKQDTALLRLFSVI